MRIDVREHTRRASEDEARHNGCRLALVSLEAIEQFAEEGEWSEPLHVRVEVGADGLVEFWFKRSEAAA